MRTKETSIVASALYGAILLSGCSKNEPAPRELLGAAKMAVHDAERGDHTAELAPVELQNAQSKLSQAERAIDRRDNMLARRMGEQAIVDAELAKAKTLTAQTNFGVHEERDALHDVQRGMQKY